MSSAHRLSRSPRRQEPVRPSAIRSSPGIRKGSWAAVLASARFLSLDEPSVDGRIDEFTFASRLSSFLRSSLRDGEDFGLAATGRLRVPDVPRPQVDRLLDDRRVAAFVRRFTARWLRLDRLGSMPPERGGPFRIYWDRQMAPQLLRQTDAFFADLIANDGPVRHVVASDYAFLNERVASILYGRSDVWTDGFRRVSLDDPRRGGLITMPAVMVATSNGVDTSPVVRGVRLLESILGTPPSPPPPDVEPLSPDLRGAATIRDRLEAHREAPECRACHDEIDPYGFALESFDPIGRWRTRYPDSGREIDTSSTLRDGREVPDVGAMQAWLVEREEDLARSLAVRLLQCAIGRRLEPADRGEVDGIVRASMSGGARLRDLIHRVAASELLSSE